jgi:peptidoglycan-associated lipoprotein
MKSKVIQINMQPLKLSTRIFCTGILIFLVSCASKVPLNELARSELRSANSDSSLGMQNDSSSGVLSPREIKAVDLTGLPLDATANIVYFDFDSYVIKPEFLGLLELKAKQLKGNSGRKVLLSGHTDESGGREYNLALGQKRAEAVKRSLGIFGVAESQLEAVSYGKEKLAVQGSGEAAGEKNRRVEISNR